MAQLSELCLYSMDLKDYQRRTVDDIELFLRALQSERAKGNDNHASLDAYMSLGLGNYNERKNALGQDLPDISIKMPTGGGKTLIATQALGLIHRTILRERNGAGLALWVVPSTQIYNDTLKRLSDRRDMYRVMLEHAVGRRIEMWERASINRLSPARLADCLNILIIKLAGANRETKEQLRFFRDSGGAITGHFPPESDSDAHRKLKEQVPNLDMIADDLVATSVGNLVRICRPAVILDEGHKATSKLARETIEGFNPSIVVELSATPKVVKTKGVVVHKPNIVSRVSGTELLDEQMIKLPLNIATSGAGDWKDVLTRARDKRANLAEQAVGLYQSEGEWHERLIRPIVLVQVERTGKDQRDGKHIHTEDVREHLTQRLDVPENAIKVKTSDKDDIEGLNLMDPGSPVEWIITKAALQEGWDCPFAYILVSLNQTFSKRSMTQLVGRVLRQPHQARTPVEDLNQSYVYCLHAKSGEIAAGVKAALEKEGYEGEGDLVVAEGEGSRAKPERTIAIRERFQSKYAGKPFDGNIYLPRFCVKNGDEYEPLDYYRHLLAEVDVDAFEYDQIPTWQGLAEAVESAKDRFYRVSIGQELQKRYETEVDIDETDEQVLAWIVASISVDYFSQKQLRRIARRIYDAIEASELTGHVKARLARAKFAVRDRVADFIQEQVDKQTEATFDRLFDEGRVCFYLRCEQCRFTIPKSLTIHSTQRLTRDNGDQIERSLFDYVELEGQNQYERNVAICLDKHEKVLWWFRNRVGKNNFDIQGYRKNRVYPDFVVKHDDDEAPVRQVLVLESKGAHLEGSPDTTYKRRIAEFFERAGDHLTWQQLGEGFKDHRFRFQILDEAQEFGSQWQDELHKLLESPI